jgi:hypothetical protein
MDQVGPHAGHDARAEQSGVNAAIVAIDERTAYEAALRHTRARLAQLKQGTPPPLQPGAPQVVAVDVLDLGEQVLARLCTEWFGVPDGVRFSVGTSASDQAPPRCPRDFVDVARYIFGPHPSPAVSADSPARGRAIQAAVLAWLQDNQAKLLNPAQPMPPLARAIHDGLKHLGLGVVADTLGGVMLGFTPSVFGNYTNLMRAWIDRDTGDGRHTPTLWDLQARLLQAGAEADAAAEGGAEGSAGTGAAEAYETVRDHLRPPLIAQMRRCPIPTAVWREPAGSPVPADPTGVNEPDKIVIGLHGVMQDPQAPDLMMWGGTWRGDPAYPDLHTLHACPGYGMSTGVLLGIAAGLVLAGSLRVSPSPTIVYVVG